MLALYKAVLDAGKEFNITKFGKYALDSLRQEKGLRGWGNEVRQMLGWFLPLTLIAHILVYTCHVLGLCLRVIIITFVIL